MFIVILTLITNLLLLQLSLLISRDVQADNLIKNETEFLRAAMGHEGESIDEFVEAHMTCLNDIMYFPTRDGYGLSSVANNAEKIAALQNEFENVKKKMDDETKKAQRLEQKIKVLTNGYQVCISYLCTVWCSQIVCYCLYDFGIWSHPCQY